MKQIAEWTQRLSFRVHETLQQWIIFFKNSRLARVTANLINFLGGVIVALAVGAGVVVGIIQWQPDAAHTLKVDTLAEYAQTFLEHRLVQRTIDKLEGDLQHDPYDAYAILRRGKAYLDIGKYAEAIADFTRLIEMRQEWLLTPGTVEAMGYRATAYLRMQEYDKALTDLNNAIGVSPGAWLFVIRAEVYEAQGRYSEALVDAKATIENEPTWGWARLLRGRILQKQGQYDEALLDFTHAIELDPRDDYAYYMRAQCYTALQRFELAQADLFQAVKLSPYDSLYQSALHEIRKIRTNR